MAVSWLSCTSEKLLLFPAQQRGAVQFSGLHAEALAIRPNQLEVIRQIVLHCTTHIIRTFHKWLSLLCSCMYPFCFACLRGGGRGGGDLCRMLHKRLNGGISTKHFTNDLEPYQDNDSRGGLMYGKRLLSFCKMCLIYSHIKI